MSSVAKNSSIFFGLAALSALCDFFLPGVVAGAWLGGIVLLNSAASHLPFRQWIHWVYAMSFEAFSWPGVLVLRLIPLPATIAGKGQPILLVHGYLNHGSVWILQKRRLEALGLGPIYAINLGHPFRSIRQYAEQVKDKAAEIAKETGRKDLILIGHSMGGLVSTLYATRLAPPNTVTDLITIGSPLAGTPVARIAIGLNGREMEPNSALVKELQAAIAQNKTIRFYHIATKTDQLVIPGSSAAILSNKHFIFNDIGHTSLLYSPRVTDKIQEWLS